MYNPIASITIPDDVVKAIAFMLFGYIAAAIAWGFRVELKLAKIDRDAKNNEKLSVESREDIKRLVHSHDDSRVAIARMDAKLDSIAESLKSGRSQ